jgi:hypothetical protein
MYIHQILMIEMKMEILKSMRLKEYFPQLMLPLF